MSTPQPQCQHHNNNDNTYEAWDKQGFEMQRLEPSGTNFFDYTNTYLQQVDDHNNHNDMLVRHHHVQQRQRQQRGIARAKGDDWYVLFFVLTILMFF